MDQSSCKLEEPAESLQTPKDNVKIQRKGKQLPGCGVFPVRLPDYSPSLTPLNHKVNMGYYPKLCPWYKEMKLRMENKNFREQYSIRPHSIFLPYSRGRIVDWLVWYRLAWEFNLGWPIIAEIVLWHARSGSSLRSNDIWRGCNSLLGFASNNAVTCLNEVCLLFMKRISPCSQLSQQTTSPYKYTLPFNNIFLSERNTKLCVNL